MNAQRSANVAAIANVLKVIREGERAIRNAERVVKETRSEDKWSARMHLAEIEKRVVRRVSAVQAIAQKVLAKAV
jgi:alpha-D-ribose 1-methylphosphonate 5-triphosphate synthase subunit PhnI